MPKIKHAVATRRRHKRTIKLTKGAFLGRSNLYRRSLETGKRAMVFAYRDRKVRKRDFRRLWIIRINAACRAADISYSRFIAGLKKAKVALDRKILADLAVKDSAAFNKLIELVRG